jgi:hypothetical protein
MLCRYPTLAVGDPYDGTAQANRRLKCSNEAKVLHAVTFKPAGHRQPVAAVTRRLLPEIVAALHRQLARDWADSSFAVLATEDDMLAVRFELQSLDNPRAVLAYMNTFARAPDSLCNRYSLSCEITDWNRAPGDGYLYYMWRPSWVRTANTAATATATSHAAYSSGSADSSSSSAADDKTLKASTVFSRFSSSSGGAGGGHGDSSLAGFDSLTSIGSAVAGAHT